MEDFFYQVSKDNKAATWHFKDLENDSHESNTRGVQVPERKTEPVWGAVSQS